MKSRALEPKLSCRFGQPSSRRQVDNLALVGRSRDLPVQWRDVADLRHLCRDRRSTEAEEAGDCRTAERGERKQENTSKRRVGRAEKP